MAEIPADVRSTWEERQAIREAAFIRDDWQQATKTETLIQAYCDAAQRRVVEWLARENIYENDNCLHIDGEKWMAVLADFGVEL